LINIANGFSGLNPIEQALTSKESTMNAKLASIYMGLVGTEDESLTKKADTTLGAIGEAKAAIGDVQKSVGKLGTDNVNPGFTSIAAGAGNNTREIVSAISNIDLSSGTNNNNGSDPGGNSNENNGVNSGTTGNAKTPKPLLNSGLIEKDGFDSWETPEKGAEDENGSGGSDVAVQGIDGGVPMTGKNIEVSGLDDAEDKWFDIYMLGVRDNQVETGRAYGEKTELDTLYKSTTGQDH
jgi:hypothetical protein